MARVDLVEVMEQLQPEVKRALLRTFAEELPDVPVDLNSFFRDFKRQLENYCGGFQRVPDRLVKMD